MNLHPIMLNALRPFIPPYQDPRDDLLLEEDDCPEHDDDTESDDHRGEGICPTCSGSGEGMHEGATCYACKGSGAA